MSYLTALLARARRLIRSVGAVLRRHGPVILGQYALLWLSGKRGYYLRDLLMDVPDFSAIPDTPPERLALCISGPGHDSMRYRCAHLSEQLELLGHRVDVVEAADVRLTEALPRYAFFVLHRVMADPMFEAFVREAHKRGKVVLFDTDDLVFDVAQLEYIPSFDEFSPVERQYIADTSRRNGRLMRSCNAVTVSTEYLRHYALATVGQHQTRVIPNVVSKAMLRGADAALEAADAAQMGADQAARPDTTVTIGYFSGTRTHDRDFLEAADAVLWALERYPATRLQIVGHLALDHRFDRFADRIVRVPFQPWQRLPQVYTTVDINLAPLERDSPYTESKSCIKYLEAALCLVPTIASPRSDFRRVVKPGVTGLLADTPAEWQAALARLIEFPEERRAMGARANVEVRSNETTSARAAATYATVLALTSRGAPAIPGVD